MAWKGTRPEPVRNRDRQVLDYLRKNGMSSRNKIASPPQPDGTGGLGLSQSLTYLSLYRLREAGQVKRCVSETTNELLWTAETDAPCP